MFDIANIGFLTITFLDLIDIAIVALLFYNIYKYLRGTIASQIFIGLVIVLLLSFAAQAIKLQALNMILKLITDIWIIAFIVIFQQEIRRLLIMLANNPLLRFSFNKEDPEFVKIIVDAVFDLAQVQHGALIVVIKQAGLRSIVEKGQILNANLSKELLLSIFYPRSPLHDGAVIVNENTIEAARCTLPLSTTSQVQGENLGMRHKAGLGITEEADVLSIIVSEETGSISVAENGDLKKGISKETLRQRLMKIQKEPKRHSLIGFFDAKFKKAG